MMDFTTNSKHGRSDVTSYFELSWKHFQRLTRVKHSYVGPETRDWNYTNPGGLTMRTSPYRQSGTKLRNIVSPKLMSFMHGMTY